ncbi:TetR/AcrR family transcriptional regulator [Nocardioides sp. MH1]|uniref:TetR/AcrR family transcriptional regulator n=1 Tax=Nocardioides sp. MH1 TaxID=3242490 RepID=UPI00351F94D2
MARKSTTKGWLMPDESREAPPKPRLTRDRIIDAALQMMAEQGYEAVSMRSLAKTLGTGPASLYAHVANREQLDQLVMDRIGRGLDLPVPDPEHWQEQLKQALRDTLALYRAHPGSARATLGAIPTMEGTMRIAEGLMAIMVAGGVSEQAAAWFCDLSALYVGAVAYEESIWALRAGDATEEFDHAAMDAELRGFFASLPPDRYPLLTSLAGVMTQGDGDERFEFGLDVLVGGLAAVSDRYRR